MIRLTPEQTTAQKNWFLPERPGPLVGLHVLNTGNGVCWVDRWPEPRAMCVSTADNFTLLGEVDALALTDMHSRVRGYVEISKSFVPFLKTAFPDCIAWPRVIFEQRADTPSVASRRHAVRRLESIDASQLDNLNRDNFWISKTWGGPHGLAASGFAWGAFVEGQLASVACTFYLGEKYEDLGVVTEPRFRGLGLSTACASALCEEVQARGHYPSWSTSPDNAASLRVAEKLGFILQRQDMLYLVGIPLPEPT